MGGATLAKGGFAKGMPKGGAIAKGKGKTKLPRGPDLERERVSEDSLTGTVVEWKGKFGFIEPKEPFEHEKANPKHAGKIWFSVKDIASGAEELAVGTHVEFH